jgi:hypothetical protein
MADLTTRQHVTFLIAPMKSDGTPAPVQPGSVVVASSDETVITVVMDAANELAGDVSAVAAGGPASFSVTADADMGAGVVTITGRSEDIMVTVDPRDQAATFTITLGAPADKSPPPPPGP